MAGFFNQFLQQLGTGDTIKDYQHAARTFVDGLYRLGPKSTALFHVFIDVNPSVAIMDQNTQIEIGLMAKSINLPKYTIKTKTYNAYNRKNIAQESITYEPITITFHDDSANVVRNFWYDYFSYYYRDSDHQEPLYLADHKYEKRNTQQWGFTPKQTSLTGTPNYINAIRIYSLHQKSFSSYTLIRPTITSFQHGEHTMGEYNLLEHSMQISYEAVHYATGPVSDGTVMGFSVIHYDHTPSPLNSVGGGTHSILGPGGFVQGAGDVIKNLNEGNLGAAALGALRTYNNIKKSDVKQVASAEFKQIAMNVLRGQNSTSPVFVPTAQSVLDGLAKATNSQKRKNDGRIDL